MAVVVTGGVEELLCEAILWYRVCQSEAYYLICRRSIGVMAAMAKPRDRKCLS